MASASGPNTTTFHETTIPGPRVVTLDNVQEDITIPLQLRRRDGGPITATLRTQREDLANLSPPELLRELCTPPDVVQNTNRLLQREVQQLDADEPGRGRPFDFLRRFMNEGEVALPTQLPAVAEPPPPIVEPDESERMPHLLVANVDGVFYQFDSEQQFFAFHQEMVTQLNARQAALDAGSAELDELDTALTQENRELDAQQEAAATRLEEQAAIQKRREKNWRRAKNASLLLPRVVGSVVTTAFTAVVFEPEMGVRALKWIWDIDHSKQTD